MAVVVEQAQAREALDTAVAEETAARVAVARAASPAERVAAQDRLAVASAVVAGASERSRAADSQAADSLAAGMEPTPPPSEQATASRRDRGAAAERAPSRASFETDDGSSGWPYLIVVTALALLFPMAWRRASGV